MHLYVQGVNVSMFYILALTRLSMVHAILYGSVGAFVYELHLINKDLLIFVIKHLMCDMI